MSRAGIQDPVQRFLLRYKPSERVLLSGLLLEEKAAVDQIIIPSKNQRGNLYKTTLSRDYSVSAVTYVPKGTVIASSTVMNVAPLQTVDYGRVFIIYTKKETSIYPLSSRILKTGRQVVIITSPLRQSESCELPGPFVLARLPVGRDELPRASGEWSAKMSACPCLVPVCGSRVRILTVSSLLTQESRCVAS
ncbi:hypothetical protein J6590_012214 [Homalodisca vitripennis]|nr:hypothetical protein J6590_012214 [Homalodisca vitripennis]